MLTATLRADASSRFSPDNRWGISLQLRQPGV